MRPHRHGLLAVLCVGILLARGIAQGESGKRTTVKEQITELLLQARTSGALAGTAMTLLNAMANKKVKGIDVALAKRRLYRLRYKVVALREDAPELTKSDLMIYKEQLTDPSLKVLLDLMKDADPEGQEFSSVTYDRISRGYTFVVCGDGDIFAFTIRPSDSGLPGADMYIVAPRSTLVLRDLAIQVQGQKPSVATVTCDLRGSELRIAHELTGHKQPGLVASIGADRSAIRIRVESAKPISDMWIASIDDAAKAICVGPGHLIKEPKNVLLPAQGQKLETCWVGLDFAGGLSLVQASDRPATRLNVDAEKRVYAMHAAPAHSFWLVPSSKGMADAEKRYQSLVRGSR